MRPLLQLHLLGRVSLTLASGAPAPGALLQPRKLALLAYLALEQRPVPRHELAALMWGHVTDDRARASLNQLLHSIRTHVPRDPFIAEGSAVRLDPAVVSCDAVDFYGISATFALSSWCDVRTPRSCPASY